MRIATAITAFSLVAAVAAPALAQPGGRVSDPEFIKAARCETLYRSTLLGSADASGITAFMKAQAQGRDPYIRDKADNARDDAARAIRKAKTDAAKEALIAERDGACAAYKG